MNIVIILSVIAAGFFLLYFIIKNQLLKQINPEALYKDVKDELNQIIVEMNRTTETNIGLLEDKINTISELLSRADKRILLLKREGEKLSISKTYNHLVQQAKPVPPAAPQAPVEEKKEEKPPELSLQEKVLQLNHEGVSKNIIANKLNVSIGEVELIISLNEAG